MAELDRQCEVVVVGAGYSGLAAARHLARAGADVMVLDARHRVGGRSFTDVTEAGFTVDRGGQWIGPTQGHLAALAAELGVATFPTYTTGQGVELRDGKRELYVGLIPTSDPTVPPTASPACSIWTSPPSTCPSRRRGRRPTRQPWTRRRSPPTSTRHLESAAARSILEVAVKAIFGTGSGELSLLFALFYLHAGGGLTNLARTTGGAQEGRFVGGSQQLAEGMAAELGERVILGAPVASVAYGPDHVAVGARLVAPATIRLTPAGAAEPLRVRARRAIFAMSPALCGRLTYTPVLPGRRDQLCQRMPMGAVTKVHVLYDRPFWRDEGSPARSWPRAASWRARSTTHPRTLPTAPSSGSLPATNAAGWRPPGPAARRARRPGRPRASLRPTGAHPDRGRRAALAGRALHPRRPGGRERPRRAHGARPRTS